MSYRKSLKDTKKFNHDRVEMRCANQRRNLADLNVKVSNLQFEIERLQRENQHVIWLKNRNEALDKDNKHLRQLLKECRKIIKNDLLEVVVYPNGEEIKKEKIITRINAAIGESEE